MENTTPDKSIKFVVWIFRTLAIDEEMEIKIPSNSIHVVVNILNFLCFSQNINVFHFLIGHLAVCINQILSQLESKFIFRKISESLIN
jgi:hypothetical protein